PSCEFLPVHAASRVASVNGVRVARAGLAFRLAPRCELLVHELRRRAHVLDELGVRLLDGLLAVLTGGRAGDLERVLDDAGQALAGEPRLEAFRVRAGDQSVQEALAPVRERLRALLRRRGIVGEERLEPGLPLGELPHARLEPGPPHRFAISGVGAPPRTVAG